MGLPLVAFLIGAPGIIRAATPVTCEVAIGQAEARFAIPAGLLLAMGHVEAGRPDPVTGAARIWPWTTNSEGSGQFHPDASSAIEAVRALQSRGVRSIDVGCVQVNLMYHSAAFATLEAAFDPQANTLYGARYLRQLYAELGAWPKAVAAYHSRTPEFGETYAARVGIWSGHASPPRLPLPIYAVWPPPGVQYAATPPAGYVFRAFAPALRPMSFAAR